MGLFSKKKKEVTAQSNDVVGSFQNSQTSASLEGNDQGAVQQDAQNVQQVQQTQQPQPNAADIYNTMPGANGPSQTDVVLPEEASVLSDKRAKIKHPTKDYRYTIINGVGKKEQGTFEAESENDVRKFLLSQDYQVLEVKESSKFDIDIGANSKIGASDLSFSLTQLSTYIKAGIPLADSVRILAKQTRKANLKKSFNQLVYQLLKGESLSDAMLMQDKVYPKLLVNMIKTAEMTGDLPSILDDMAEYYTSMDQTRKQMKSAMTYPVVVLTIAFGVLIFMLTYLVPQFSTMFADNGAEMPALTLAILSLSDFIKTTQPASGTSYIKIAPSYSNESNGTATANATAKCSAGAGYTDGYTNESHTATEDSVAVGITKTAGTSRYIICYTGTYTKKTT